MLDRRRSQHFGFCGDGSWNRGGRYEGTRTSHTHGHRTTFGRSCRAPSVERHLTTSLEALLLHFPFALQELPLSLEFALREAPTSDHGSMLQCAYHCGVSEAKPCGDSTREDDSQVTSVLHTIFLMNTTQIVDTARLHHVQSRQSA